MTSHIRSRARVTLVALALPLTVARSQQAANADEGLRNTLTLRVATGKNPAIIVGIYENGTTRFVPMGASGAPNKQLDENTVFEIGSITKVFTSTLLADMVARHLVAFDDPVDKYLPTGG